MTSSEVAVALLIVLVILLIYYLKTPCDKKDMLRALPLYVIPGKYEPRYVPSSVN